MVQEALKAHEILKEEGINAKVINIHTIKPIDRNLIISAAKETKAIVTAEEHSIIGGLGSAVLEVLSDEYPVPLKRVGILDTFGESGKPKDLLEKYRLTADEIVRQVKEVIKL
jgi:transketolase